MVRRPRSILVVDNDPDFLLFMNELLLDEGHRVQTAGTVLAARMRIGAARPDVIISDLLIWGSEPAAVASMLVADPQLAGIPLLICSAALRELAALSGLSRLGGMETLSKPFAIEDLLERLERLFDAGDELGLSGSMD